jgi:nucleoside-diphosphate-sugar epimerase
METESATYEWELGTGVNYSLNQIADMFGSDIDRVYLPDKPHNYRETIRKNDAALTELGWKPEDRIQEYLRMRGSATPRTPPAPRENDTGPVLDERCNLS